MKIYLHFKIRFILKYLNLFIKIKKQTTNYNINQFLSTFKSKLLKLKF